MKRTLAAIIGATCIAVFAAPMAQANSISGVEGARAKERQGAYLNRTDREQLRRYGGNDDYGWRARYRDDDYDYSYGYDDEVYGYDDEVYGYDEGRGVSVYVGPGGVSVGGY